MEMIHKMTKKNTTQNRAEIIPAINVFSVGSIYFCWAILPKGPWRGPTDSILVYVSLRWASFIYEHLVGVPLTNEF